ncbi:MAG TPA: hypothetical protein VFA20_00780 [Myxococcaceae bacterium]|nr:hypothetical protein [Myxococcaceae bacterium]
MLFAWGVAARAATAPTSSPASRDEFHFTISMIGASVSYWDTPLAFESGSAGELPGVKQMVEPFGAAPFSGLRAYGLRLEQRGIIHHVRLGLGGQIAFPRWRLADVNGIYDVDGVARHISATAVSSKDLRLSIGLDLPIGPVHLYGDVVGTLRFISTRLLIDGDEAKFGATSFGYSAEAGVALSVSDGLRLGLQVERGLVGEEAWGGSLVLAFVTD